MYFVGFWPDAWRTHRLHPLFKKGIYFHPNNYRGLHITSILSKIAEKMIAAGLSRAFQKHMYGVNQWAYSKGKSAQDAICYIIHTWIYHICNGCKVGLYMTDISGAFDRVDTNLLLAKLRQAGFNDACTDFFSSYLSARRAFVTVGGSRSELFTIDQMVYQGTVFGPVLWNVFFGDISQFSRTEGGSEIIFADDLNIWNKFSRNTEDQIILQNLERTQTRVHKWGKLNRVQFEATKEHMHIIHPLLHDGSVFRLLGILFDAGLNMQEDISSITQRCAPKIRVILRTKRFYNNKDLINQFSTHIWSFIEHHTSGIYHATRTQLHSVDRLQSSFLRELDIDARTAFLEYNFGPLQLRRDIAMLGFLHKRVLGLAHEHFSELFPFAAGVVSNYAERFPKHNKQLKSFSGNFEFREMLWRRSVFGLVQIYNKLPQSFIDSHSVHDFQVCLTEFARTRCTENLPDWIYTYDPQQHFDNLQ